jgi:hypothetical protein
MTMKIKLAWTTQITEHHSIVLPVEDVPRWVLDILEERESGIAEGEFIDPTTDDLQFLTDREDPGTTLDHSANEEQSYIFRIETVEPTREEVGYRTADAIAVAEYGANSQAGLASFVTQVQVDGVTVAETRRIDLT